MTLPPVAPRSHLPTPIPPIPPIASLPLFMGALSDRVARPVVIAAGLSVCGGAAFLVPLAESFPTLLPIVALGS